MDKELGSCTICGYIARTEEEVRLWSMWSCCRVERIESEHGFQTRTCRLDSTGKYIPPSEDETIQRPDPQEFKDLFCKKYQPKEKKDESVKRK